MAESVQPSGSEKSAVPAEPGVHPSWLGPLIIAAAVVAFAILSWRKWPDPLIDFGQQLYLPWRLSHGAVLYHDVSYVYGCLSVCYHAALFKIFGASLNVVLASNFVILILLLLLVYRLFLKCSDAVAATAIGLALATLAFSQLLDVGNYNYLCPYSHEEFHGIVLSVAMMALLARWLQTDGKTPLAFAGGCLGLVFLTKPEVFVAALAPWAVAAVLQCRRISAATLPQSLLLAVVGAFIPLAGFFLWFHSRMDSADALRAVCGAWLPLLHSSGLQLPIYRRNLGLDAPLLHVARALMEFGGLAVVVGICAWRLTRPIVASLERTLLFGLLGGASVCYGWQNCGHALPLLLLAAAILWWCERRRTSDFGLRTSDFGILWLAFSLLLLAKLGLNPRVSHFGVFLAMPAFLSAFYLLLYLAPRFLQGLGLETKTFRAAMMIFLLAGLSHLTIQSALFYHDKDFAVGTGGDRFIAYNPKVDPTGAAVAAAASWIETYTAPTNTVAVLPEGVMLNYLTRRINPTPYAVFAFEVWAFGEQNMLAAYEKNPPDYIVLVHRDTSEYGVPYFGAAKGFGLDMMQWIDRNYRPVWLKGNEPLETGGFGIKILKRTAPDSRPVSCGAFRLPQAT